MSEVRTVVSIRSLQLDKVRLGVYPEEKRRSTLVVIDASCRVKTPASDELNDTLDYTKMKHTIETVAMKCHFELLETMAKEIAVELAKLSNVIEETSVRVCKPLALTNGTAEVTVSLKPTLSFS